MKKQQAAVSDWIAVKYLVHAARQYYLCKQNFYIIDNYRIYSDSEHLKVGCLITCVILYKCFQIAF